MSRALVDAPGPAPRDMLRDLRRMLADPLTYLEDVGAAHGPVVAFPMPRTPVVLVTQPADVHRILVAGHRRWTKRTIQFDTLRLVTGEGLLVSDPPLWTARRRLVQPAFHHHTLSGVAEQSVAVAAHRIDRLLRGGGGVVDLDEVMMTLALDVLGKALFSADLGADARAIVTATVKALDGVVVRARSPWLPAPHWPTPGNLRLRRALRTIDAAVQRLVTQRRAAEAPGSDVLGLLLEHGADQAVRDEMVTLLIAGHETVASALTWTLALLAADPSRQARAAEEVDQVCAGRPPTMADLAALPFVRAVVDEALRLYPPAWVISRRAAQADELAGVAVPAGTVAIISTWSLHRDPQLWKAPGEFVPERWEDTAEDHPPRWAYVPFGAGPRLCIGRDFALTEATLVLATLLQRARLRPALPTEALPKAKALVTLRPAGGLPVLVTPRSAGPG